LLSQDLDEGESLMAGGVTPLTQDGVEGYIYTEMPPITDRLFFESSGLLYQFIVMWPEFGEHQEVDKAIDSIKFFD
jgi:hypothetical protein